MGNNDNILNEAIEPLYKLYLASALGAFCLGFGDLLNNDKAATVLKLAEIIKQHLYSNLENGGLVAFALLVVLGGCVCWIHQPRTRVDAFSRGFSVFAVLAVVAPYQPVTKGLDGTFSEKDVKKELNSSSFLGVSAAYAQQPIAGVPLEDKSERGAVTPTFRSQAQTATITIDPEDKKEVVPNAVVTIRDPATAKILGVEKIEGSKFSITRTKGEYLLEVEVPGHRRTSSEVQIGTENKSYSLPIERSRIPLSIQRLYAPQEVNVEPK